MRNIIVAALLLFPTAAMAGTFVYTPVHIAPVVHVAPMVHVAPTVHATNPGAHVHSAVTPAPVIKRKVSQRKVLPVVADPVVSPVPPKKCTDQNSGSKECAKK